MLCDSRKIHCLTREFLVKFHTKNTNFNYTNVIRTLDSFFCHLQFRMARMQKNWNLKYANVFKCRSDIFQNAHTFKWRAFLRKFHLILSFWFLGMILILNQVPSFTTSYDLKSATLWWQYPSLEVSPFNSRLYEYIENQQTRKQTTFLGPKTSFLSLGWKGILKCLPVGSSLFNLKSTHLQ